MKNNNQERTAKYAEFCKEYEENLPRECRYVDYNEILNRIFLGITKEDKTKDIIEDICETLAKRIIELTYFQHGLQEAVIGIGELHEKDLTKYINKEERKVFTIPEHIKRKVKEKEETIDNSRNLVVINRYKYINNTIKNLDIKEQDEIIKKAIIERFKSTGYTVEKYIERGVSIIIDKIFKDENYLENELEFIEEEINNIDDDDDYTKEEKKDIVKNREVEKIIINEINTETGMKVLKKKIAQIIQSKLDYESKLAETEKFYEKLEQVTNKIYSEDKNTITFKEIFNYLNNSKSWSRIRHQFNEASFYMLVLGAKYTELAPVEFDSNKEDKTDYSYLDYTKEEYYDLIEKTYKRK